MSALEEVVGRTLRQMLVCLMTFEIKSAEEGEDIVYMDYIYDGSTTVRVKQAARTRATRRAARRLERGTIDTRRTPGTSSRRYASP